MSIDEQTTTVIIELLNDSKNAYEQAIKQLGDGSDDGVDALKHAVSQRALFAQELDDLAAAYGDDIENEGSPEGAAKQGLEKLKDKLVDQSNKDILKSCAQGDQELINGYQEAIGQDISDSLKKLLQLQLGKVQDMHTTISTLAE